jgi:hypothetical protein
MARRRLLSDELLAPFWAWASDEHAEPGRSRPHRQEDYVWSTADQPPAGTLRPLRQRQSLLVA